MCHVWKSHSTQCVLQYWYSQDSRSILSAKGKGPRKDPRKGYKLWHYDKSNTVKAHQLLALYSNVIVERVLHMNHHTVGTCMWQLYKQQLLPMQVFHFPTRFFSLCQTRRCAHSVSTNIHKAQNHIGHWHLHGDLVGTLTLVFGSWCQIHVSIIKSQTGDVPVSTSTPTKLHLTIGMHIHDWQACCIAGKMEDTAQPVLYYQEKLSTWLLTGDKYDRFTGTFASYAYMERMSTLLLGSLGSCATLPSIKLAYGAPHSSLLDLCARPPCWRWHTGGRSWAVVSEWAAECSFLTISGSEVATNC